LGDCGGALEKSIVDEASAAENMKNPLLFPSEGPSFPDPNDSVLVAPTKIDSDMIKQSFCQRTTSCNLHNNEIANSCTQEVQIGRYTYKSEDDENDDLKGELFHSRNQNHLKFHNLHMLLQSVYYNLVKNITGNKRINT
jgi:hypothetical protein